MDNTNSGSSEVTLQLNVKTADGVKGMKDLAAGTREAGTAAKGTQKEFDALAEAQKRLAAVDRERAVREQVQRLRPAAAFNPADQVRRQREEQDRNRMVDMERWRQTPIGQRSILPPGAGGGALGMAASVLGGGYLARNVIDAAGGAASHIGQLAAQRATTTGTDVSESEARKAFTNRLAEGIPIVGSFIKSIADAGRELSGLSAHVQMLQAGVTLTDRQQSAQRAEMQAKAQAAESLYGIRTRVGDVQAGAAGSAAYAASLTQDRLAQFRGPYGEGLESAAKAESAAAVARSQLAQRQAALAATGSETGRLRESAGRTSREADEAERWRAAQSRYVSQLQHGGGSFRFPGRITDAKKGEAEASQEAIVASGKALEANKQLQENLALKQNQLKDVEQARVKIAEAELAAAQALLNVKGQIAGSTRQSAIRAGMGTQSGLAQDNQLLEIYRKYGIDALTPDQKGRLAGMPGMEGQVERAAIDARKNDPLFQRHQELINQGRPAGLQGFGGKGVDEQEDEVRKDRAAAEAEAGQKRAAAATGAGKELAGAVTDAMNLIVDSFKVEIKRQVERQILMNKGN